VTLLLSQYADELKTAMIYAGCKSLADISPSALYRPPKN